MTFGLERRLTGSGPLGLAACALALFVSGAAVAQVDLSAQIAAGNEARLR